MEIHESIRHIKESKDELGAMFYERLFRQYPEVQQYYRDVDLERQSSLLATALMVVEGHATRSTPAMELYLQHLGTRHHDSQIPKDAYDVWIEAMLETMQEFHGQDWTPRLKSQWRRAFDRAVEIMFRGYDRRITV
jgi:hemoglobin-like flavoprotein